MCAMDIGEVLGLSHVIR